MDPIIRQHIDAVVEYLGREPNYRQLSFLSDTDWDNKFGRDSEIFGKTGAYFTKDRDILIRGKGNESLLHELLHSAGLEDGTIGEEFNEGFTELVAREIAAEYRLPATVSGYGDLVSKVRNYVLPLVGVPLQQLARKYAESQDKARLLAGIIARRHAHHFYNREDWGNSSDPAVLEKELMKVFGYSPFNTFPYLDYLVNEVLPKNESFFRFLQSTFTSRTF